MDTLKALAQPLLSGGASSSVVDGMKLVVLGGTVETARRLSSSAWSHFVNSFFLTAHFCEEEHTYDWLLLWLSRRPEWQRSREFEATIKSSSSYSSSSSSSYGGSSYGGSSYGASNPGTGTNKSPADLEWEEAEREWAAYHNASTDPSSSSYWTEEENPIEKPPTRIIFRPTYDSTHTLFFRSHMLRVRRTRRLDTNSEVISISVIARSNAILKQLVLEAKKEYEREQVHRVQVFVGESHGGWRFADSRAKRPLSSIVLGAGVKEALVADCVDFLRSEQWYSTRGIPFRRGYLLYGVPGSGKSSLIHALAGYLGLDVYVCSLSAAWMSDGALMGLMGRLPRRCVVLLEDLDAAFWRGSSRDNTDSNADSDSEDTNDSATAHVKGLSAFGSESFPAPAPPPPGYRVGRRRYEMQHAHAQIGATNTLSLSGLLNALDGISAPEGRLLFATTNHLDRIDEALRRPGRMDVWIEFGNAKRDQVEGLFRGFFPVEQEWENDEEGKVVIAEGERGGVTVKGQEEAQEKKDKVEDNDDEEEPSEEELAELEEALKGVKFESAPWNPPSPPSAVPQGGATVPTSPSALIAADANVPALTTTTTQPPATPSSLSSIWGYASSSASGLISSAGSSLGSLGSMGSLPFGRSAGPASSTSASTPSSPAVLSRVSSNGGSQPLSRPANGRGAKSQNSETPTRGQAQAPSRPNAAPFRLNRPPITPQTLERLAKQFADGVPEGEFSVAGLQGYLLKHKSNPYVAAANVGEWVESERALRAKLAREKEEKEKKAAERRAKRKAEKEAAKKAEEEKEKEKDKDKDKAKTDDEKEKEKSEKMDEDEDQPCGKKGEEGEDAKKVDEGKEDKTSEEAKKREKRAAEMERLKRLLKEREEEEELEMLRAQVAAKTKTTVKAGKEENNEKASLTKEESEDEKENWSDALP